MDVAMVERLASPAGWSLLQALPEYDESTALQLQTRLREHGLDPELLAAAMGQARLRARAREKFGEFARGMLFTSDGLEQSSRLPIAARHAGRFAGAGISLVHDLGCGLGSDAMAMAALGLQIHAVDADPVTAAMAAVNLRHWPDSSARCTRAEQVRLPTGPGAHTTGVWADPARRTTGVADARGRTRRVFSLDGITPSWNEVRGFAAQVPATGAKLSPAFPHAAIPAGTEAQWSSWHGEVLECAIWWGPLAETAGRTAAVCTEQSASVVTEASAADGADSEPLDSVDTMGDWLYEADRAVIRAGLTGALVAAVDGTELGPGTGYVTSWAAYELAWARRYRVRAAFPFSTKALGRWLREHGHDRVTIKKRGVSIEADVLRRQLKMTGHGRGGSEATVVLTRVGGRQVAVVVELA
ncbi:MAG: class I SAM-dependent methyltransferase [Intrasporangium sp.]|nr:class I SAM-dependent methyltransferase [Intrasporangium sp.]MDN5796712.1 class I SAM-dependent methyltransferase [Intrasporangium sp.]